MSGTERCDVSGCSEPAFVRVLPTHGKTDHSALRCRDCLEYDVGRGWFQDWKEAIDGRDERQVDAGGDR